MFLFAVFQFKSILRVTINFYDMKNLHKIVLIVTLLFSCASVENAQKFTVSNVIVNDERPHYVQNIKNKGLGSRVELSFFEKDVRVTMYDDGEPESVIFTKIDYDTYKYTHSSTEYYILNINRVFEDCGYIISASLKIYRNGNLKIDVNLKRD